jgi:hypothetical protein
VIERLKAQVQRLQVRVAELERQVHRNSRNSAQPPSADGLTNPPPRSQRRPSGRPRGGQLGHPGETLKKADHPECQGQFDNRQKRQEEVAKRANGISAIGPGLNRHFGQPKIARVIE